MDIKKEIEGIKKENDDLKKINHQQRIEITDLMKEIKLLEKKLEEVEGKKPSTPDFIKESVKKKHKKTGQKKGHKGYSRYIPERIDEVKKHNLDSCPNCGGNVSKTQEIRERVVTDMEVNVVNTKHVIHRKYCKNCKKIVEPEVDEALPNCRFSLRLMLLIMLMKVGLRLPSEKIIDFLTIFGVDISDGEIYTILDRLKEEFGGYYEELVLKMRKAPHKYMDETGWRIFGNNHWMWILVNKEIAIYLIKKKRSSQVPIKFLGNQEGKSMTTDRFNAYNVVVEKTGISQQICWAHLLRNAKDLAEHYSEAEYIFRRLKYIFGKSREVSKDRLLHWIDLVAENRKRCKSSEVKKFVRSVCVKYRENLFRFVDNPEIEPTNNMAERGLRHGVVIRKISGGSRSEKGAETTARLLSVVETVKKQEGNIMDNLVNVLQKGK